MQTLSQYITQTRIDGHIHLFDHRGLIDKSLFKSKQKCVCFADIVFKYDDKYKNNKMLSYYDDFISKYYNGDKHILLATGNNANDIINIYNKYPDIIKGFGELKCYSECLQGKLPYGDIEWILPLMEFNKDLNLPVYIHLDLDSLYNRAQLETLLKLYKFPIVLCHCGMVKSNNMNEKIYSFILGILSLYSNLYIDISKDESCNFFLKNTNKLFNIKDRIIFGTDINQSIKEMHTNYKDIINHIYNRLEQLNRLINTNTLINKLFAK